MRRVVITGIGVVTPFGNDLERFWASLLQGRSGVRPIERFDVSAFPTQIAAEIKSYSSPDPTADPNWPETERIEEYALGAAWLAWNDSGLSRDGWEEARGGVSLACGLGNYGHEEFFSACSAGTAVSGEFDESRFAGQYRRALARRAAERRSPGNVAARVAQRFGIRGPVQSVMTACSAGTQAIGDALRWVQLGDADCVLAGGADSEIYPMGLASFCLLRALSRRNDRPEEASCPFDRKRDGFVLGEGAAFLMLEDFRHAARRGARIYAEVAGFGSACDAYRVTDPHPEGIGAVLAMKRALARGGVRLEQVGYINAHGTSTRMNDVAETKAIRQVFGNWAPRIAVSATKSMIGHLTVASGAIEAVVTALSLRDQRVHPTLNYRDPDPECDLDYVPEAERRLTADYAISNSFAFGGQCACLLLRRYDAAISEATELPG